MALAHPGALIAPGREVVRPIGRTCHAGHAQAARLALQPLTPLQRLLIAGTFHMVVEVTGCYLLAPETRAPRGPTGEDCQHGQDMFGLCVRTPPGSLTTRVSY